MVLKKRDQIKYAAEKYRNCCIPISMTNGVFDLFHAGHADFLKKIGRAENHTPVVFVGIDSDARVARKKGGNRPIIPEEQRAFILSQNENVDFVFAFDDEEYTIFDAIADIQPDFYFKANDYNIYSVDQDEKSALFRANPNVKIDFLKIDVNVSTSSIIKKINESAS